MLSPAPRPPAAPSADGASRWAWLGLVVVLGAFAIFLKVNFVPAILEPDDNGYFAQGSLIARTGRSWFVAESDIQYIGMHWLLTPSETYISRYPPGMAMVIAAVFALFGYQASVLVNPVMALLALLGTFTVARRLTSPWWAVACAALLAVNPTFTTHALTGDSHMFLTAVLVWGVALLLRWHDTGKPRDVFLAGLVLGCVPTVRYPDSVVALGVVAFLLASYRRFPRIQRHYGAALLGAAIPIVALLVRNHLVLGAFWRTGYSLTHEQSGFSPAFFTDHFGIYLRNLSGDGLRVIFGLGLIGAVWMVSDRRVRATGLLLLVSTTSMLLLYMAYYWAGGMVGTMRFMLPTFPLYLVAAIWTLRAATTQAPLAVRISAPLLLLGLQVSSSGAESLRTAAQQRHQKTVLATVTAGLERATQPGDIIVTQGELLQHLDFVRDWRIADEAIARAGSVELLGRFHPRDETAPGAPGAIQQLKVARLNEKLGTSTEARRARFIAELRTWARGAKVFLVTPERMMRFGVASTAPAGSLRIVARVPLPRPPEALWLNARSGLKGGPEPLRAPYAAAPTGAPPTGDAATDQPGAALPPATTGEGDFIIAEWQP